MNDQKLMNMPTVAKIFLLYFKEKVEFKPSYKIRNYEQENCHNFKIYFSHQIAMCAANAFSFFRDCPITSLAVHPQYLSKIHDNYIRSDSDTEKSFRQFS